MADSQQGEVTEPDHGVKIIITEASQDESEPAVNVDEANNNNEVG